MAKPKTKTPKRSGSASAAAAEIGIIGGSGLYAMPGLERAREVRVKTPFGEPSDALVIGTLEGQARGVPGAARARPSLYAFGD